MAGPTPSGAARARHTPPAAAVVASARRRASRPSSPVDNGGGGGDGAARSPPPGRLASALVSLAGARLAAAVTRWVADAGGNDRVAPRGLTGVAVVVGALEAGLLAAAVVGVALVLGAGFLLWRWTR